MKNTTFLLPLLPLLLAFLSCAAADKSPIPAQTKFSSTEEKLVDRPEWEREWQDTLTQAKKEGKLVALSTADPEVREAMRQAFKNKTGIEIETLAGRGGELSARLIAEQRAGLYLTDVYVGGSQTSVTTLKPAGVLAPLKSLLFLPEILDPQIWFWKNLPWLDKEKSLVLAFLAFPADTREIGWNTSLIRKDEVATLHDLLKPQFKGTINMQDPTSAGKGGKWFYSALKIYKGIDIDFMKALARQDPLITRDKRLQIEWLAKGKNKIALLPDNTTIKEFISLGASIDYLSPLEARPRIATGSGSLALVKNAPHPQTAKLFVNWLLSREGQIIYSKSYNTQSARVDVPTDFLPSEEIRDPLLKYAMEDEDFLIETTQFLPLSLEIFGPLLR